MNFDPETSKETILKLLGSKGVELAKKTKLSDYKSDDEAYNNLFGRIPSKFDARKKWRNL